MSRPPQPPSGDPAPRSSEPAYDYELAPPTLRGPRPRGPLRAEPPPPLEDDSESPPAKRTTRSPVPRSAPPDDLGDGEGSGWGLVLIAFGALAALLTLGVVLLLVFRAPPPKKDVPQPVIKDGSDQAKAAPPKTEAVASATDASAESADEFEPTLSAPALEFLRETLAPYLVVVTAQAGNTRRVGGIVADPSGSIATPLSTVRRSSRVIATPASLSSSERPAVREAAGVESPGAVAIDRECDWVLLDAAPLPGAPIRGLPRGFDRPPAQGDRVVAAGVGKSGEALAFECEVREVVELAEFDEASRRALTSRGWNVDRFDWRIVGPATQTPLPGAGLFSRDGQWLGLVASRTPDGTGLLVATGKELGSMFESVGPSTDGFDALDLPGDEAVASAGPTPPSAEEIDRVLGKPDPEESNVHPADVAASEPSAFEDSPPFAVEAPVSAVSSEEAKWTSATENLTETLTRVEAGDLFAETLEEYLELADAAENLTTYGKRFKSAPDSAAKASWGVERDRALELFATSPWQKDFALAEHNDLAGEHVDAVKGIFLYGEVTAAKDEIAADGGVQPILFQAIGRSDRYLVDMSKNSDEFTKGSRWLVLGTADPLRKINLRTSSDDKVTICPILEVKFAIARPEEGGSAAKPKPGATEKDEPEDEEASDKALETAAR